MISQLEFYRLRISEKPAGYYMDRLLTQLDECRAKRLKRNSHNIRDIADVVLARAQMHLCQRAGYVCETTNADYDRAAQDFLAAFNALAQARFQVERELR